MRDTTTITIIVSPTGSAGMFTALVNGKVIVTASREPLCATARVLLAEGIETSISIAMKHAGSSTIALRAKIGTAAKLTVDGTMGPSSPAGSLSRLGGVAARAFKRRAGTQHIPRTF